MSQEEEAKTNGLRSAFGGELAGLSKRELMAAIIAGGAATELPPDTDGTGMKKRRKAFAVAVVHTADALLLALEQVV